MLSNKIALGIDQIKEINPDDYPGQIAYLCHSASMSADFIHGIDIFMEKFGKRLLKIFSPQHGLMGTMQDNMIESDHFFPPYYQRQVYSLYSETRAPTPEMLKDLDYLFIDLQDIGSRIYTYIYTTIFSMQACGENNVKVVILDRPNPIGGQQVEGNLLDLDFKSFVGMLPLPARHGLTIGEVAKMSKQLWGYDCDLEIIPMQGWKRDSYWDEYPLFWPAPSPNMPCVNAAVTFPATVMFEGTNISEARGTSFPLEVIGHPEFEPFQHLSPLNKLFQQFKLSGFILRPIYFRPTYQKHAHKDCGGYQIHVTDRRVFKPWSVGIILNYYLYQVLGNSFQWKEPPYEYEYHKPPIDMIHGTDIIRREIEKQNSLDEILNLEQQLPEFLEQRKEFLLY